MARDLLDGVPVAAWPLGGPLALVWELDAASFPVPALRRTVGVREWAGVIVSAVLFGQLMALVWE